MSTMAAFRRRLLATAIAALAFATQLSAQERAGAVPGGCVDAPQRPSAIGCYLIAKQSLERLPDEPIFWHIYSYPARAEAAATTSGASGTIADSFDKVWLLTIAGAKWRPAAGQRVAVIGPLPVTRAQRYVARYMEATFPPNQTLTTLVHRHSGPEAWYVVSGAQCLRTPDETMVVRAGQSGIVPPGPPMVLTSIGAEIRRALVLVLHDASEPWQTSTTEWTPTRECPK